VILESAIRDLANNPLSGGTQSWTFRTTSAPDVDPPTLTSSTPADNATNIATAGTISLVFSENVNGADNSGIILERADNAVQVTRTIVYSSLSKTATITPLTALAEGTQYRIRLLSSIKDSALNSMTPRSITFTTADETKPSIVSHNPVNGAGAVSPNTTLSIIFSEPVIGLDSTTCRITNKDGDVEVSGDRTYTAASNTLTFTPDGGFAENAEFEVRLTNGIRDTAGNTLTTYVFSFATAVLRTTRRRLLYLRLTLTLRRIRPAFRVQVRSIFISMNRLPNKYRNHYVEKRRNWRIKCQLQHQL
jgi:methionine-rich copper-binding protein CopC